MKRNIKKDRSLLIQAAMQKIPCDLTINNIQFVNVITGEIYPAEVDVIDGYVVRVREQGQVTEVPSGQVYDGQGCYLIPGFIDSHMHVESTMMIPENLSRAIVPWGTTTICTDPHEIGNVQGVEGVTFMLQNARNSMLRQYVLAPSCVPAVPGVEFSGAEFGAAEIRQMLAMDDVIGIAELMDYVGVCNDADRMHDIMEAGIEKGAFLQGHGPLLGGKELNAYKISGIESDHESETREEIIEKLRMGIHINLRASSLVDHLTHLVEGIKSVPYHDFISVCTDDIHARDILKKGHLNQVVAKAIAAGLEPVDVIRMATLNAAREYGFDDLGAIAPGFIADMQLVRELDGRCPEAVFMSGRLVGQNGVYVGPDKAEAGMAFPNTMQLSWITGSSDFSLMAAKADHQDVNVIIPVDGTNVLRRIECQKLPVKDGKVSIEGRDDLAYVCVINRHGRQQKTIAVIQNFGLKKGAIGTTISHDSHNLVIIYKQEADAFAVAKKLQECGGGLCAVDRGEVLACLELPVAGLMSDKPCAEVAAAFQKYEAAHYQVCDQKTPVLASAVMSLTALPGMIVTDCGLVDGSTQEIVATIL